MKVIQKENLQMESLNIKNIFRCERKKKFFFPKENKILNIWLLLHYAEWVNIHDVPFIKLNTDVCPV